MRETLSAVFARQIGLSVSESAMFMSVVVLGGLVNTASSRSLLIDADRVVPGRFAPDTGAIEFARLEEPDVDDLLDDLSEQVVRTGGEVVIVPADKMPSDTGIAAIYRF